MSISVGFIENSNLRISIYNRVLSRSTATSEQIQAFVYDVGGYQLLGSELSLRFHKTEPSIIRSVKYYRWSLNHQTLVDMGVFRDTDNQSYNFQQDFFNNYYVHFINNNVRTANSSNECMVSAD